MNEFLTNEHTQVLNKLVTEIVNDPATYLGSKYIPEVALPVRKVRAEIIEASGGLTNEHIPDTDPQYITDFATRVQEFEPSQYKESTHYGEKRILFLRELGQNDPSKRGIRQYIDKSVDRLKRRLEARIEKLRWDSIFNGGFTFMGETVSFGVPSGNLAIPVVADWSTDGVTANSSANPLVDVRYWTLGGLSQFRKYKFKRMVMNPNTARWVLDNANVQLLVRYFFASGAFIGAYELQKTLSLLIPGSPVVEIYDGWYQTETEDTNGKITVSDATYFVPDAYIFFETNLPGGDKIGEFVETVHLASGSIDAPGFGKFLVFDDNIAPGTKGGPKNPYLDIVGGVYGGVNLYRSFDVLTANTRGK